MKNHFTYFYNITPTDITNNQLNYFFTDNDEYYWYTPYYRQVKQAKEIKEISEELNKLNILCHEIILSNQKDIITIYNNTNYILLKININPQTITNISDFIYLTNINLDIKYQNNWAKLWSDKIDYLEYQMGQLGTKYPILCDYFDYYIGLAENAISYLNNTIAKENSVNSEKLSVCHFRATYNMKLIDFYNPLLMIYDHPTRNISEYIKSAFFKNVECYSILNNFIHNHHLSLFGIKLLISRLMFPSYFFDLYEEIVSGNINETEILKVIELSEEYEDFMQQVFAYFKSFIDIPLIDWLV